MLSFYTSFPGSHWLRTDWWGNRGVGGVNPPNFQPFQLWASSLLWFEGKPSHLEKQILRGRLKDAEMQ